MARRKSYAPPKYRKAIRLGSITDALQSELLGENIAEQEKIQADYDKRKRIAKGIIDVAMFIGSGGASAVKGAGMKTMGKILGKQAGLNLATDYLYDLLPEWITGPKGDFDKARVGGFRDTKRQKEQDKMISEAEERHEKPEFKERAWSAGKGSISSVMGAKALGGLETNLSGWLAETPVGQYVRGAESPFLELTTSGGKEILALESMTPEVAAEMAKDRFKYNLLRPQAWGTQAMRGR